MSDDSTIAASSLATLLDTGRRETDGKPAALLVVSGESVGTVYDLDASEISVGRGSAADIALEYAGISRQHFRLHMQADDCVLHDCDSKNGTFINDVRVDAPVTLRKGDLIRLGPTVLQYLPKGDPERLAYDNLKRRAQLDSFTGCYNKNYFNERIELEVRNSKHRGEPLSLIMLDLDHFKRINDHHGHDAGDFVLKQLAELIHANGVRKHDVFARYGGEEFVILLPATQLAAAVEIAERLRGLVDAHVFRYADQHLPVTVSVGVAEHDDSITCGTDLFRRADAAMYGAKAAGRNRVCAHDG